MEKPIIITLKALINASIERVWEVWTEPRHITQWYFATEDWQALYAENDLRIKGKFKIIMKAKDGSLGFDFSGVYTDIREKELIEYDILDGRHVKINFIPAVGGTLIIQDVQAEKINSIQKQEEGWQNILDNFKKYLEKDNNNQQESYAKNNSSPMV